MLKLLLALAAIALVVWAVVRILGLRHAGGTLRDPRRRQPPPRVTGPDDDPDFLRDLDRRRRRRQEDGPGDPGP